MPGDQKRKLARAPEAAADALILDLEDAVAKSAKADARRNVADFLGGPRAAGGPDIWVRVNSFATASDAVMADLDAVLAPGLDGICLPKASSPEDLLRLDALLSSGEERLGLKDGSLAVAALVESAEGLLSSPQIASARRVCRLQLGEVDLHNDLGVVDPPEAALISLRLQVVTASAAAGIQAPVAGISRETRELEGLRVETEALRRLGFGARSAIHPAQVSVINEVFTPSTFEEEEAARLVAAFDEAVSGGVGVIVDDRGKMIDEAVVRRARRTLAQAEQARARASQ